LSWHVAPIGGDGTYTYGWSPATGLSDPKAANPVFTASAAGSLTFILTVTDGQETTASDGVVITVVEAASARIVDVDSGLWHNVLSLDDGTIRTWGYNNHGQLGDGSLGDDIVSADAGSLSTLVAKADGTAWVFGFSAFGQLGAAPVHVPGISDVVQVGTLTAGGILLKGDGTVWGFIQSHGNCELAGGAAYGDAVLEPVQIPGLADVTTIATGEHHAVALDSTGTAWVWGWVFGCTPWAVLDNVTAVAAGTSGHCLFLLDDGTVLAMGFNLMAQLGNGTRTSNYNTATQVIGMTNVVDIAAGDRHSMFLKSDGTLWTCGWARNGRLGLSDDVLAAAGNDLLYGKYLTVPKQVGLADVAAIGGGQTHSVAVQGDGTVWAWGYNTYEQLSGGTSTSLPDAVATPVQIDFGE